MTNTSLTITADAVIGGAELKIRYARSERRRRWRAFLLVAPLLLFICITFLAPVGRMLFRSVDNAFIHEALSNTREALTKWDADGEALPPDAAFAAMIQDAKTGEKDKALTKVGQRLNFQISGVSSMFRKTARRAPKLADDITNPREALIKIDKRWGDIEVWRGIKFFTAPYTGNYYYDAADFRYDPQTNAYERRAENERVYVKLFWRTILMSALITFIAFLMGYPTAFLISSLPPKSANWLLILVLLPFWTSLLVRTTSWIVLLYSKGVVNNTLVFFGVVANNDRPELIHNATGTIIAMTHILLPFMILPIYSVMKTIPPSYMRAARSMGANAWTAFWRVYFPLSLPGVGAGGLLVFILAIGYYITPELVGGAEGTFISNRIAYHIRSSGNWGLASALGLMLLALVLLLYWFYDRIIGVDKMKLG